MQTNNSTSLYTTQHSNSSLESHDGEGVSSDNTTGYEPVQGRLCRKAPPTIATGRRSKHLVLEGDEAMKREKRREKNREAARKLKEKRQLIEEELDRKLHGLENEHSDLQGYLRQLHYRKHILEQEINDLLVDPLDNLLANTNQDMLLLFEQYSDDSDQFDEVLDRLLYPDLYKNSNL